MVWGDLLIWYVIEQHKCWVLPLGSLPNHKTYYLLYCHFCRVLPLSDFLNLKIRCRFLLYCHLSNPPFLQNCIDCRYSLLLQKILRSINIIQTYEKLRNKFIARKRFLIFKYYKLKIKAFLYLFYSL